MNAVAVRAGMDLPPLAVEHRLQPVLRSALTSRRGATHDGEPKSVRDVNATQGCRSYAHWDAAFFGVDATRIFRDAGEDERRAIANRLGRGLLEEAYFIEKSGVGYAAKMVLLAETIDERMLYALFGADETSHFSAIRRFLPDESEPTENPFLALLTETIEGGDRATLQLVVQIVLEGWGLVHYRRMRDACAHGELRATFDRILADEAAHHGSGRVLFSTSALSAASERFAIDVLVRFFRMVQAGPQGVLAAVESVKGHLSRAQRIAILAELDAEAHAATRLGELRALVSAARAPRIESALDAAGVFRPLTPEECA